MQEVSEIDSLSSVAIGSLVGTTQPIRASKPFVLAGLQWLAPRDAHLELRVLHVNRRWSRWVRASATGHEPDGDEAPFPISFGDPVWTGPAVAVQLRSADPVSGVTVHLVRARRPAGHLARESPRGASAARSFGSLPLAEPRLPAGSGQPPIIAREAWAGHHHGHRGTPWYGDVRMGFVHHSDGINLYSRAEVPQVILAIYDYHVYARGWSDIGYNFAIDRFGQIWEARAGGIDQAVVGAQAGGYNLESFGVVVLGTFSQFLPTQAAIDALERFLAWKLPLHGVSVRGDTTVEVDPPGAIFTRFRKGQHVRLPTIAGHRDGCETYCPGTALYDHLPVVRRSVHRLVGRRQLRLTIELGGSATAGKPVSSPGTSPVTATTPATAATPTTEIPQPHSDGLKHETFLRLELVTIHVGDQVPVSGRLLTLTGEPVAGAPIQLQGVRGMHKHVLATVTTDAKGNWSTTVSPKTSMLVRGLHPVAPATASPLVLVGVAPVVTLEADEPGGGVVHGTVTPAKPHVMVTVRYASGRHRVVEQLHLKASEGRFHHRLKLPRGHYHVQAHTVPDADYVEGWSAKVGLRVS